jgi:glucoamylase
LEIYTRRRPIRSIAAGGTLRILDERQFEVVWSADGWQTTNTTLSRSLGYAGFSADIAEGIQSGEVEWTLHWVVQDGPGQDGWLGYNVKVQVDAI